MNNLRALLHLDPGIELEGGFKEIFEVRGIGALSKDEISLLREFEITTALLLNPMIQEPHAVSGGGVDVDIERTPLFQFGALFGSWGAESAAIVLGAILRLINSVSVDRLKLSDVEVMAVFGFTIRSEDGFSSHISMHEIKALFELIERAREIGEVRVLNRGGHGLERGAITQEDFWVRFLEKPSA